MKFNKHINISYVILVASLWAVAAQSQQFERTSPLSGLPIKQECDNDYRHGLEVYQSAVEQKDKNFAARFSKEASAIRTECQEDFSLGLMDARLYLQQSILVEYGLEMNFAARKFSEGSAPYSLYQRAMKSFFGQKLSAGFLDPNLVNTALLNNVETKKGLAQFSLRLVESSRQQRKPVQFGRFIFTPNGEPFTSFDYVITSQGKLAELPSGELRVEKGSYQKKAEMIVHSAIEVAQAYVDYRPKMVIGQDSLLTAVLEEKIYGTDFNQTLRGKREAAPFDVMVVLMRMASEMQLDLKPLVQIQKHMFEKQHAVLDRDIKATKVFLTGMVLAPLVPYAIKFGSWALSSYGAHLGLSYVAEGAAWKLHVGSFLYSHATTISVLSSLVAVVGSRGVQVYEAIQEHKKDPRGFTLAHMADAITVSLVSAVPMAIAAPVVTAGAITGGVQASSFLATETTQLLVQLSNGFRYAKSIGYTQAAINVARAAPGAMFKAWCNAWWTKTPTGIVMNTKFIALVASYNVATVVAEIATREARQDPDQKFFTPNGINKLSVYSLTQKTLVSIVTGPIIKMDSFWARWATWRLIDLVSTGLVTYVIDGGKVNRPYVKFEVMYGATVSAAFGEVERVAQMSIFNSGLGAGKSFWIQTALKMGIMFPKAAVRNVLMDMYMGRIPVDHDALLKMLKGELGLEFKNFTEEEIEQGIEDFRNDPDVREFMKIPMSELQKRPSTP